MSQKNNVLTFSCILQEMPTISIVIPAYNEEQYIGECLRSIVKTKTPSIVQILVVDNASTDRTSEVASSHEGVTVIHESKKGTNAARQAGLQVATGDIVAYVDADCVLPDGWFLMIERTFDREPKTVCLSGPCHYHDASLPMRVLIELYWWLLALPMSWLTHSVLVGGNFAARKSALHAIGGFDTSLTFYGDDTNLGRRLRTVGTVFFSMRFRNSSSARRLMKHGIFRTGTVYAKNFLSQAFLNKSVTESHTDVR